MRLRILITSLIIILALTTGCIAEQSSGDKANSTEGLRPVIYPSGKALKFPEDQVIKKELQITAEWQTITFEKPLEINRRGSMGLHLVVDQEPYISTLDDDPLNPEVSKEEFLLNAFSLRRRSDGALVRPEAFLIGDNGEEVSVRPDGHLYPFFDMHVMTVALRMFKDVDAPAPPFPEDIKTIKAMRIRSTTPFLVRYLLWTVDRHPDMY